MAEKLLEMKQITKSFPGVKALENVDLELRSGEVHALLGENGAGKSTLMKILGGIYDIDEGDIFINGKEVTITNVKEAQEHGVNIIHQELALVPYLSIAENIYLGREPRNKMGMIKFNEIFRESQKLIESFGLKVDARTNVRHLTVAQQQMVEIIKAVSFNAKIIVMDEPTSSLTDREVESLFETIESLRKKGVGIIYISHRMEELFTISDRITVLRDGEYVGTVETKTTEHDELIEMMVGRNLENFYVRDYIEPGEKVFEVKGLSKKDVLEDINFDLKEGEILGFSGLVGAGRSELMKCIFGLDTFEEGKIIVDGKEVSIKDPQEAIKNGIAYVPEDRRVEGLFLDQAVRYNVSITILDRFINKLRVKRDIENEEVDNYLESLSVRTPNREQHVGKLSGGNQQKVLIAKWLATGPRVLIVDEPTRGVDVGAKAEIYEIMNELIKTGVSIIMISSDLPEVINMSDRVAVMEYGEINAILDRNEFSQEKIMHYATGGR